MARIGITVTIDPDGGFGLFSNDLRQIPFFLQRLFKSKGHTAVLISGPNSEVPKQNLLELGFDNEDLVAVTSDLDLLIVVSRLLDPAEFEDHKSQGTKIVRFINGALAVDACASVVEGAPMAETWTDRDHYSEIWMNVATAQTSKSWAEVVYQCPVRVLPPVWYPIFLPKDFGFQDIQPNPEDDVRSWSIGIFEPNNTVTKTSHFPIMAVHYAKSAQTLGHRIGEVLIVNEKQGPHFTSMVDFLRTQGTKVWTLGSLVRPQLLNQRCSMIVSHDIENGLDFMYFEALFGGWPLVHCSRHLHMGYTYTRYDAAQAGLKIREAMMTHDPLKTRKEFKKLLPLFQNADAYEAGL